MSETNKDKIRESVREHYKGVALSARGSCCSSASTDCCSSPSVHPKKDSQEMGYSSEEVNAVPQGANLGLGCGNPQAIARLQNGEVVLDLGSGGGFDCFLAAKQVGAQGHVIGVDMTPDMISLARKNVEKTAFKNVEFRLGEIENLPVADGAVDVILSNCVINLSPDKQRVYKEAFRVLKSGGRIAFSDVVKTAPMPKEVLEDMALYSSCVSGSVLIEEIEAMLKEAGFTSIKIEPKDESKKFIRKWVPHGRLEDFVISASIEGIKP
ncbi:MAG: arsenite methyltransferase [Deltaproteobacteria bacterium]|nr:arsenite methyltransferase [Deltaproteobacteria bacterium]